MNYIYIILVLIIVGLVWVVWKSYQHNEADKKEILALGKERDEFASFGSGLEEYNKKMQEKKNQAKDKIMEMLNGNPPSQKASARQVSHKDVVKALDVSKNTAVRYLDELEAENKVKQVGKTGKSVFYIKS
jgi:predicted HTH transcriptional regulator